MKKKHDKYILDKGPKINVFKNNKNNDNLFLKILILKKDIRKPLKL